MTGQLPGFKDRRTLPPEGRMAEYAQVPANSSRLQHQLGAIYDECRVCADHWVHVADASALRRQMDAPAVTHVPLRFTLRGGALGAYCVVRQGDTGPITARWVNLNRMYLIDNLEHFVDSVIPRHIAQVVTGTWWKDWAMPYGDEWCEVMALFKLPTRKAHPDAHKGETRYHRVEDQS